MKNLSIICCDTCYLMSEYDFSERASFAEITLK